MAQDGEPDFFDNDTQRDLFGSAPAPAYRPDPDKVRSRLHKILAEARAAETLPWEPTTVSLYRTIFPQMAGFLPADEGAQLCFQFDEELARLKAALNPHVPARSTAAPSRGFRSKPSTNTRRPRWSVTVML